jgi:hypothetical protein
MQIEAVVIVGKRWGNGLGWLARREVVRGGLFVLTLKSDQPL